MRNAILLALTIGILCGCQSGGGSQVVPFSRESLGVVTSSTATGIRSLYISKIDVVKNSGTGARVASSATSSLGDVISTLAYIDVSGNNVPVVFETSEGKQVILKVTDSKVIRDGYIALAFDALVEVLVSGASVEEKSYESVIGNALVDMNSGKAYDLTGYDILNVLVDDTHIYITKNARSGLYRIDLDDLSTAVPLNNPAYTPAMTLLYITNGWLIAGNHCFDINGVKTPKTLGSVFLTSDVSTMTGPGEPFSGGIEIYDNRSNPPYIVDRAGNVWGYRHDTNGKFGKFQMSVDADGNTIVSNYQEFTLSNTNTWLAPFLINGSGNYADQLVLGDQTFYYVRRNADSGITFETGTASFGNDYPGWAGNCAVYYDGSIYWISNGTIYAMNLSQNVKSTVYSSPDLVDPVYISVENALKYITMRVTNGRIIFYQYITPTDVGTYALTIGNTEPVLLSESTVDIDTILELTF